MLALGAGVAVQRSCQLLAFVLVGNALGVTGLGVFAQGQAMAAVLVVLAGAGVRNVTARRLAREPAAARALILGAVRLRLALGSAAVAAVAMVAFPCTAAPWFWILCALQVAPAAFDLKNLLDATGRTRAEVAIETAVAALQLLAVALVCASPAPDLTTLAAIALGGRCAYAAGAIAVVAALQRDRGTAAAAPRWSIAAGEAAHQLLTAGDVWLVALALGDAAAGYYAFAVRFAAAALVPSAQLARLLLPHLLHAGGGGDGARTLATALRATALATLPMLAGGAALASDLCSVVAARFAAAAPTLQLLLLAGCMQHLGWQCSHALLASHRDRAYAFGLLAPSLLHLAAIVATAALPATAPEHAAVRAAIAAVSAHGTYLAIGLLATSAAWRASAHRCVAPVAVAAATGVAVHVASALPLGRAAGLALQLAAGAAAGAGGVWWVELRRRWRQVGDGLAAASGLRS